MIKIKINIFDWYNLIVDLLKIERVDVVFKQGEQYFNMDSELLDFEPFDLVSNKKGITLYEEGYVNPLIYIDIDLHSANEEYISLAHELRHVYQVKQTKLNTKESQVWNENLKNYYDSRVSEYQKQPLEVDANAFAKWVIEFYLDREIEVYNTDEELFKKCYALINFKYNNMN